MPIPRRNFLVSACSFLGISAGCVNLGEENPTAIPVKALYLRNPHPFIIEISIRSYDGEILVSDSTYSIEAATEKRGGEKMIHESWMDESRFVTIDAEFGGFSQSINTKKMLDVGEDYTNSDCLEIFIEFVSDNRISFTSNINSGCSF